jgi:quinol monooxygenase YgiN
MIARVLTVDVDPASVEDVIEAYRASVRPIHERATGLAAHHVLVDRERGRICFVGVWKSADALRAVADELEPARARLWATFGQEPQLEVYDVADTIIRPT